MSDTDLYSNDYENNVPGMREFRHSERREASLADMEIPPEEILMVSGIGQAAKPRISAVQFFPRTSRAGAARGHRGQAGKS